MDGSHARFGVRIIYIEPEFHRRNPAAPPEFCFTWVGIPAGSPEEAIDMVRRRWDEMAFHSRVGWRREIKSMTILRGPEDGADGEPF